MRVPASALALLFTCGSPSEPARSNLVVIVVDTLRADHLGLHGYERDTSPFLDEIAQQGMVFENAQSVSSFTRESVSALLTGYLPSTSGSIGWYATPPEHLLNHPIKQKVTRAFGPLCETCLRTTLSYPQAKQSKYTHHNITP